MNKKSCVLCRNFISIYKINRTLHGRLGIRILSSRAESISHSFASLTRERYFQHSKIKFVSPRGHVISSISVLQYMTGGQGPITTRVTFTKLYRPYFKPKTAIKNKYLENLYVGAQLKNDTPPRPPHLRNSDRLTRC